MIACKCTPEFIATALYVLAPIAVADSHDDHRFSLSVGAFITDRDTEAQLDGTNSEGTPTDFEKVEIQVTDDMTEFSLPAGSRAQVAVYSDHWHHVAIMRKILLRMSSWQNYLYLDH